MNEETKYHYLINKVKNNWFLTIVGLVIVTTIMLAELGDSLHRLWELRASRSGLIGDIIVHNRSKPIDAQEHYWGSLNDIPSRLVPPILDIKIINRTGNTQYINKIVIKATRASFNEPSLECWGMQSKPTGFYDLDFNLGTESQVKNISVSHVLQPDETDRLIFSLAPDGPIGVAVFQVSVVIKTLAGDDIRMVPVKVKLKNEGSCSSPVKRKPAFKLLSESPPNQALQLTAGSSVCFQRSFFYQSSVC